MTICVQMSSHSTRGYTSTFLHKSSRCDILIVATVCVTIMTGMLRLHERFSTSHTGMCMDMWKDMCAGICMDVAIRALSAHAYAHVHAHSYTHGFSYDLHALAYTRVHVQQQWRTLKSRRSTSTFADLLRDGCKTSLGTSWSPWLISEAVRKTGLFKENSPAAHQLLQQHMCNYNSLENPLPGNGRLRSD